jgi:hypothetical protein
MAVVGTAIIDLFAVAFARDSKPTQMRRTMARIQLYRPILASRRRFTVESFNFITNKIRLADSRASWTT